MYGLDERAKVMVNLIVTIDNQVNTYSLFAMWLRNDDIITLHF